MTSTMIDRGHNGRNPRLGRLDTESYADFVDGFRGWVFSDLNAMARERAETMIAQVGADSERLPVAEARDMFERDPVIRTRLRCWITSQEMMWRSLSDHFEGHRQTYREQLEDAENAPDATLELNPDLPVPDYARHEIHLQPGGYTADELAGAVYFEGSKIFFAGHNDADEIHLAIASQVAVPEDGIVDRVVDLGCGPGQLAVALKERFVDAQVWGLDVAAPMVRHAHLRARQMGHEMHFAQRLAEDTHLADASVDIAAAFILFHEVPPEAARAICAEVMRVLRPGGVFTIVDFHTGDRRPDRSAYRRYMAWADHHYNTERWAHAFLSSDFARTLVDAGFELSFGRDPMPAIATYIARKP